MGRPTLLFFGSPENSALSLLYQHLVGDETFRVVFWPIELFPTRAGFWMDCEGSGLLPTVPGEEPILSEDLVTVCVDGVYIDDRQLTDFDPESQQYVQTESWAALIAWLYRLSESCLVANLVLERGHLIDRWSELCYLASHDLPVPEVLVSSDPDEARDFIEQAPPPVFYKRLSASSATFLEFDPARSGELDKIVHSPVHFESFPPGDLVRYVVIRKKLYPVGDLEREAPRDILDRLLEASDDLGLVLAEFALRYCPAAAVEDEPESAWMVVGLTPFLTSTALEHPPILKAALQVLRQGLEVNV